MDFRSISWIVTNLIAFFVPLATLVETFGVDTRVDTNSATHLLAIAGAAAFGFVVSLVGARIVRKGKVLGLQDVIDIVAKTNG